MRTPRIAWMTTWTTVALTVAALVATAAPARAGALEDGKSALRDRRWIQAADAFEQVLKATPAQRDAAVGLAQAAAEGRLVDRYDLATGALSAVLRASAEDREARLAYGYLFLARAVVDPRFREDAQEQFDRLLRKNADDEDAAIGLSRYFYFGGEYDRAEALLDGLLVKRPKSAGAHYWKGMLHYDQAKEAVAGGMTPAVVAQFQAAAKAFEAAAQADPARRDAWMQLAYADQYLSSVDAAREAAAEAAYLKALEVEPSDDGPLRGLSSLYARKSERYAEIVARLMKERPKSGAVLFHGASQAKAAGRFDDALAALRTYVTVAANPARGWFEIGEILREKRNDLDGARKAYEETLRADPVFPRAETAVTWLLQPIREKSREAVASVAAAKALLKEFDAVIALAPKSITAKNDAAFFLREAFDATGKHDRELLDACLARYVAASALIGEFMPGYESIPYADRHGFAQVLNDTGLMFQYYPAVADLLKAEKYYRMAMDWTEYGYWDTYGNLMKLLDAQKRLLDAMTFAENCAEGIKQPDGTPQETFRKIAAADAERLKKLYEASDK
jgi:thioredoxin-like negative regulator of GroEL